MTRIDLLEAASIKLAEAVLLLIKAGEQHFGYKCWGIGRDCRVPRI